MHKNFVSPWGEGGIRGGGMLSGACGFFVVVLAFDMLSVCEKSFCQGQEAFGGKTKRCGKFGCAFLFPELSQI